MKDVEVALQLMEFALNNNAAPTDGSDQSGKRPVAIPENEDEVLQDTSFAKSAASAVEERPSKRIRREDSPREEGASEDIRRGAPRRGYAGLCDSEFC